MHPKLAPKVLSVTICLGLLLSGQAFGQCILANPSFELGAAGASTFGGWNQFGVVGSNTVAHHGSMAATVTGFGVWDVSAYWQSQDCSPGEQWEATGHVQHPSGKPLTGGSVALVNIEWRDSVDALIDYDSFTVATASTPTDEYIDFTVLSTPAPAGTVKTRLLVGILQQGGQPSGDVYFDQVTFFSTSSPTIDAVQWNDFPGGRTVDFGGHSWRVKGTGLYGPGNNLFSDAASSVWVDAGGRLHMTLQTTGGPWWSTEVVTDEALGYGDYILTTEGRLDLIDPQAVLGIFLWEYGPCWDYGYTWWNAFNEIDIEYSRWGNPGSDLAQFVAQPFDYPGNISRFDASFSDGELVSHAMRWHSDLVEYRVWRGGPDDESPQNMIHSWSYSGPHIPRPEQPRMHLNLWKLEGTPASNQEIVFDDFRFTPQGGLSAVGDDLPGRIPAVASGRLHPAAPNPFNPRTMLHFELDRGQEVELHVYDLAGRHVRTLFAGYLPAGEHRDSWAGLDDGGETVSSGVYLIRLNGSDFVETRRVTLIK
jgi:hypothetical protein